MAVAPKPSRRTRRGGVVVHGNVAGSIQIGDHNLLVNDNHGTIVVERHVPTRTRRPAAPPPRPPSPFVARRSELARLRAAVAERRPMTVSGEAGAGRTALMRAAAGGPDVALPDGVVRVDGVDEAGTALSVADLAQRLHDALWDTVPPAKVTLESARSELGRLEALAIVDDVSLIDAELERLVDLLPSGAVLVATTRPSPGGDIDDVPVGALERPDSIALLAARAGLDPAIVADPAAGAGLDAMSALLADWPAALVVAGRAIGARRLGLADARDILGSAEPSPGPPQAAALERAYLLALPALDANAIRLLVAASAMPGRSHDPALLRRLLGDPDWFDGASGRLQEMGLLTLNSPRYRVPDGVRAVVVAAAGGVASAGIRDRHLEATLEATGSRALEPEFVRDELGGLLGAFDRAVRAGRSADAIRLGRAIAPGLVLNGLWDAWRAIVRDVRGVAEEVGAAGDVAWAAHELGTRDLALGDRQAALDQLQEALDLRRRLGDTEGAAYTLHNLRRLGANPPGNGTGETVRRILLGGTILSAALLIAAFAGPGALAVLRDLVSPAASPTPGPTDAAVATASPSLPPTESPPPTDVPPPLAIATLVGAYTFDGQDWRTTVEISLSGGRGDYLVGLDGVGESRDNPSSFQLSGRACERYPVTGTASSAGEQQTPIAFEVGPRECPATPRPLDVACVTFDELEVGTQVGEPAGHSPGAEIYQTAEGIRVFVHDFLYSNEGGTFNYAEVLEPDPDFGAGPYLWFNNLNLEFDFGGLPFTPRAADFLFRDSGGNQNLSVNGSDVDRDFLMEVPSPIGGVSWTWADPDGDGVVEGTLSGSVERFLVGGQELALDTVCARREPAASPIP